MTCHKCYKQIGKLDTKYGRRFGVIDGYLLSDQTTLYCDKCYKKHKKKVRDALDYERGKYIDFYW
jgi:hypothetical protein